MYTVYADYFRAEAIPANYVAYYQNDDSYYFYEEEKPTKAYKPLLIVPRNEVHFIKKVQGEE